MFKSLMASPVSNSGQRSVSVAWLLMAMFVALLPTSVDAQPSNDDWNNAINVGSLPFARDGNNINASTQVDEQHLEILDSTVWWYFQAPADGEITIDTIGSNFDTVLHIYTGFELGFANLILVAENDDAPGGGGILQSEVTFQVNAGQFYEIRVGGYFGSQGNIQLNGVVSNDDLFDSIDVTLPFSLTASNVGATTQPGEPALEITGATVWWYFEATVNSDVTIDTFGSDFDTVLHVMTFVVANLTVVASNDDSGTGTQSEVTFPAEMGRGYLIRVGGFLGATGNIALNGEVVGGMSLVVSNLDEPFRANSPIGNPESWCAQSFLPNGTDYLLTSIEAIVGNGVDSPAVIAELRSADVNGQIDVSTTGLLTTFTAPDMSGPTVPRIFQPDSPVTLLGPETYWFVLGSSNGGTFDWSYADTNNFAGPGLIGNFGHSSDAGLTWGYGTDFPLFLQVNGIASTVLLGDVNLDGLVNLLDVTPFVDLLTSSGYLAEADVNTDGVVNLLDVGPFVDLLTGG